MSWMDSWSRPNKHTATPPPLYLTTPDAKYCSTCGRVIGARRSHQKNKVVKYCSDGCRRHRIGPLDKRIDRTILGLLSGEEGSGVERTGAMGKFKKGDKRVVITCDEIEGIVFGRGVGRDEDADVEGDGEEGEAEGGGETDEGEVTHESEGEDGLADGGVKTVEEEGELVGRKSQEEVSLDTRRQEGQRRADEREKVRRAARRAVVFGFAVGPPETNQGKSKAKGGDKEQPSEEAPRRRCEAVMNGQVVEPSFAKGNWSIRWRE